MLFSISYLWPKPRLGSYDPRESIYLNYGLHDGLHYDVATCPGTLMTTTELATTNLFWSLQQLEQYLHGVQLIAIHHYLWQEYFDKLFNGENENTTIQLDVSFDDTNRRFVRSIQESKVREALKRMKGGKAMDPDGIPIKVWRCLGDIAIV